MTMPSRASRALIDGALTYGVAALNILDGTVIGRKISVTAIRSSSASSI